MGYIPKDKPAGLWSRDLFSSIMDHTSVFQNGCTNSQPYSESTVLTAPRPHYHLVCQLLNFFSYFVRNTVVSHCGFNFHFPCGVNDIKHFSCGFDHWLSSFTKGLLNSLHVLSGAPWWLQYKYLLLQCVTCPFILINHSSPLRPVLFESIPRSWGYSSMLSSGSVNTSRRVTILPSHT